MSANGQTPTWGEKTNECTLKRKSKYYPKKIKKRKSKGGKFGHILSLPLDPLEKS
ncbi:hypothetical protein MTR_1g056860 [Medicago truncatula]|uniref:Uncharacterized protein n=1 Tax=Medicago truncatula TaxID=3880 RepID=A0A072VJX4_MEDTR|nr:hypothetical protein MTR_1g056860 [Medicago truncatula]